METDAALTVGCELVEQGLAHRRGTLGIMGRQRASSRDAQTK
jgi:hypothetical protein